MMTYLNVILKLQGYIEEKMLQYGELKKSNEEIFSLRKVSLTLRCHWEKHLFSSISLFSIYTIRIDVGFFVCFLFH